MSIQGAADRRLSADYDAENEAAQMATLFKAHLSPAFSALVRIRAGLDPPGTAPSLATCEKVPTSDPDLARERPTEYRLVERVTAAREAIQAALGRSRERQRKVLALIQAGEPAHAKRLANCMRKSVQLECPTMAGGCGSDDNYQLITCDSRLCEPCQRRRMGQKASQYAGEVAGWDHPTMIRLSLPKRVEPTEEEIGKAVGALRGAHGRLRRRVVPPDGPGWSWADWKGKLCMVGARETARRWQKRYVSQGRGIPFDEVVRTGFYGIDIKQGNDGSLNVHMHVLADAPWIPQAALSNLWDDLIAAPVVDVRRIDGRDDQDAEAAVMEVVAYAAKPPEWQTVEGEVQYLKALKGSKLVQPFGELHGNTPDLLGRLCCADCEQAPRWWNYVGVVRGAYQTMALEGSSADGDRPPPGQGSTAEGGPDR